MQAGRITRATYYHIYDFAKKELKKKYNVYKRTRSSLILKLVMYLFKRAFLYYYAIFGYECNLLGTKDVTSALIYITQLQRILGIFLHISASTCVCH